MVNLGVKLKFHFRSEVFSAMKNVGKPYDRVWFMFMVAWNSSMAVNKLPWRLSCEQSIYACMED